VLRFNKSLSTQ